MIFGRKQKKSNHVAKDSAKMLQSPSAHANDLYGSVTLSDDATSSQDVAFSALLKEPLLKPQSPLKAAIQESIPFPKRPKNLKQAGLSLGQVADLLVKLLYLQGTLLGLECADHLKLPFSVVDEGLHFLTDEKCIEVASGEMMGRVSYRFHLTDLGRIRAREAFDQCKYVGPAPIDLADYIKQCQLQTVVGIPCDETRLTAALGDYILRDGLIDELGAAVCSGKSIFIYGPPGNGKTMIAKGLGTFLNQYGGDIYIPYAIQTEGNIITLFDPTVHQATDENEDTEIVTHAPLPRGESPMMMDTSEVDRRWRKIRRPVIITGGELTLDMLEFRYSEVGKYYQAPLHIKANGGVFLIDDFGRQLVPPKDLLNRWIVPLEEKVDHLTLATGKKLAIPFEQLIVFSTNLDPKELVDQAFLRRIRHKIEICAPTQEMFAEIFRQECSRRGIAYSSSATQHLFERHYNQDKLPRSSDPRDLLDISESICRFKKQPFELTVPLLSQAASQFFCKLQ